MQVDVQYILVFITTILTLVFVSFLPKEKRWIALLIASTLLYWAMVSNLMCVILLFSIYVFLCGLNILRFSPNVYRIVIVLALVPLLFLKLELHNLLNRNILGVLGISYFTFNGLSYLIDIRRKYIQPDRNYWMVLLYLIYYPHIFAGPLHKYKTLTTQFKNEIELKSLNFSLGFRLILWGVFKQSIIAKYFSVLYEYFNTSDKYSGFALPLQGFFFFFYLYTIFSSYIEIIQGISQLFNIQTASNFQNRVYASVSRQEFWKGWHMALNNWFRDYFFFAFVKYAKNKTAVNCLLFFTFLLIALWHGLTKQYFIWGILNGLWIILEKKVYNPQKSGERSRVSRVLGMSYHLIIASFIASIFISEDITTYFSTLSSKTNLNNTDFTFIINHVKYLCIPFFLMDYHYRKAKNERIDVYIGKKTLFHRWFLYFQLIILILIFGIDSNILNYYYRF